jgi:hypothetical protein
MDVVPIVNYVMPPLDEDMLHGYEDFMPPRKVPAADNDEDEDDSNDDGESGSQTASSPRALSVDF